MTFYLPVYVVTPLAVQPVSVNGNGKMDVYDEAAAAHEVPNNPNVSATLGGQFEVFDVGGTTSNLIGYAGGAIDPVPLPIFIGVQVAGERAQGGDP